MSFKKFFVTVLIFLLVVLAAFIVILCYKQKEKYADGTWVGVGSGRNGPIVVSVVTEKSVIKSAELVSMEESEYALPAITDILEQVVSKNSIKNLDAVSGATLTSNGTIEAIKDALSKARRNK